ncbi:hypothetical protein [Helicobacter sp. 23-1045]
MKATIIFLLGILFFSGCSLQEPMTPQEIDEKAIAPHKRIKLFSPPPNGYARLIMYRDSVVFDGSRYDIFVKYKHYGLYDKTLLSDMVFDRALCKIE